MPTSANTHIDAAISQLMIRRMVDAESLICNKLFTPLVVDRAADKYYKFDGSNSRVPNTQRQAASEANRDSYDYTTDSFNAVRYALKDFIDDDIMANADNVIKRNYNYRKASAMNLVDKLLLDKERRASATAFNTSTFSGKTAALSGNDQFSDYANSTPFETISDACDNVLKQSGKQPNTIIMGQEVWSKLRNHPQLIDRLPDNRARAANINVFKEMLSDEDLDIQNVLVGKQTYNSADEGQTPAYNFIWGKFLLVAYINPNASTVMQQTLAKTFIPKDLAGMQVEYYRLKQYKGEWCEVNAKYAHKIVSTDCGYLYSTVVA